MATNLYYLPSNVEPKTFILKWKNSNLAGLRST